LRESFGFSGSPIEDQQAMVRHLNAQGFDHETCDCGTGILLLARDQVSVAHSVGLEATGDDEVRRAEFFGLVLDPEGLDALAHEVVRIVLFRICEASPSFSVD
jgi:hypothetical protein